MIKDDDGNVVELHCTYDETTRSGSANSDRKVKGTIHWASAAHAVSAEVRLYDRLFREANPNAADDFMDVLNEESLEVVNAMLEPSLADLGEAEPVQFERLGYFVRDADWTAANPVLNRVVTLRDSWAKLEKQALGG